MGVFAEIFEGIDNVVSKVVDVIRAPEQSITEMAQPAMLNHRVIIEESLANNAIMPSLMSFLNQQVAGYVLTAVQLGSFVSDGRTVRDVISRVATESFVNSVDLISFNGIPKEKLHPETLVAINKLDVIGVESHSNIIELETKSSRLMSSRVLEVDLTVNSGGKDHNAKTVTVRLGIYLLPYFINTEIMSMMLDIHNQSGFFIRWKKMAAGEIRFFRDFILCFDLIEKYGKVLKSDPKNKLGDILRDNHYKELRLYAQRLSKLESKNTNIASTIIVVDHKTIQKNASDSGSNLDDYMNRQEFFNKSLAMILVVVDDMFNNVKVYYNGMKMFATCTFDTLNRIGQKSDNYDLKDIITAFGGNQNIRY